MHDRCGLTAGLPPPVEFRTMVERLGRRHIVPDVDAATRLNREIRPRTHEVSPPAKR